MFLSQKCLQFMIFRQSASLYCLETSYMLILNNVIGQNMTYKTQI